MVGAGKTGSRGRGKSCSCLNLTWCPRHLSKRSFRLASKVILMDLCRLGCFELDKPRARAGSARGRGQQLRSLATISGPKPPEAPRFTPLSGISYPPPLPPPRMNIEQGITYHNPNEGDADNSKKSFRQRRPLYCCLIMFVFLLLVVFVALAKHFGDTAPKCNGRGCNRPDPYSTMALTKEDGTEYISSVNFPSDMETR